jgi:DNA-directed RNA polymerase subunit M/transcription elongation factor TFIIS
MKNVIYAVVIAVCILISVVVFLATRGGGKSGLDSISDTEQVWVKCKSCNTSYQISRKQYYKEIGEKTAAGGATAMMYTPPLTCQKCSKNTVFLAEKCPNCGEIFLTGSVPNDFPDRCPKCKHSKTEDTRKARMAGQSQQ